LLLRRRYGAAAADSRAYESPPFPEQETPSTPPYSDSNGAVASIPDSTSSNLGRGLIIGPANMTSLPDTSTHMSVVAGADIYGWSSPTFSTSTTARWCSGHGGASSWVSSVNACDGGGGGVRGRRIGHFATPVLSYIQ
jgi:hypothetical protein